MSYVINSLRNNTLGWKLKAENEAVKKVISDKYRSHALQMTDEGFEKEYGFDKKIFWVEK